MFKTIVMSACLAGFAAGVVLTLAQWPAVVPIIIEAERYEAPASAGHEHTDAHAHAHADEHGQHWSPDNGWQRTGWTLVSNVGAAIGFSLMLCAVFVFVPQLSVLQGLLWGGAGYVVFFANPALGLRPEIPGAMAADLFDRQLWWIFAVLCSALAVGLVAMRKAVPHGALWALPLAICLLVLPHLLGAPQPATHGGLAPQALADRFVWASALANLLFWLSLGVFSALAFQRFNAAGGPSPASSTVCPE